MAEFDEKAATWDADPIRVSRAEAIAESLGKSIDLSIINRAMEYGCGTGLLSFALKDKLANVMLMDESAAMIEVAREKCEARNASHFSALQYDLLKQPLPDLKFDLIFILLTLHHIQDTAAILNRFQQLLNSDGYLAIIDLDKEDGSFHQDEFHGHHGFVRAELEEKLALSGLIPIKYEICYELERETDSGVKSYPLFMLISQKQG